ncbi:hypothetical protein [Pseudoalteromonas rubra]|uniref:hypothetical protein n=1 Tax=Pseudoalteromonas rubra TaxID=43658 RepID=UPI001107F9C8|nr:hypothetical protein [Pseudoalteromonas rubra]
MKQLLLITLCTVLCACGSGSDSATTDQSNVTSDTGNTAQDAANDGSGNTSDNSDDSNQDSSQSSTFVLSSSALSRLIKVSLNRFMAWVTNTLLNANWLSASHRL